METNDARLQRHRAAQRADARHPAGGVRAGEGDAGADRVQTGARHAQCAGRVGGVLESERAALQLELLTDSQETRQLLVGEERIGIVGGGEVGIEAFEVQIWQAQDAADDVHSFFRRRAVAGHACIDFDLDVADLAGRGRRIGDTQRAGPIGERRGQLQRDDFGEVFRIQSTQEQDRLAESRLPQPTRFADAGDGCAAGAGTYGRLGDGGGAHAIRLRLYYGSHALAGRGSGLQRMDVGGDAVEIDFDPTEH